VNRGPSSKVLKTIVHRFLDLVGLIDSSLMLRQIVANWEVTVIWLLELAQPAITFLWQNSVLARCLMSSFRIGGSSVTTEEEHFGHVPPSRSRVLSPSGVYRNQRANRGRVVSSLGTA